MLLNTLLYNDLASTIPRKINPNMYQKRKKKEKKIKATLKRYQFSSKRILYGYININCGLEDYVSNITCLFNKICELHASKTLQFYSFNCKKWCEWQLTSFKAS